EPEQRGQRTQLAVAQVAHVGLDGLAGGERGGVEAEVGRARRRGRGALRRAGGTGRPLHPGLLRARLVRARLLGARLRGVDVLRRHQMATLSGRCRPRAADRPAVINSTTWPWVTSLVCTCATIRPR